MPGRNLSYVFVLLIAMIISVLTASLEILGVTNALYDIPGLGNLPVRVKVIPSKENFQSTIYEVHGFPYGVDYDSERAIASLQSVGESGVTGDILFIQNFPPNGPTLITGNLTGLAAGKHGLHIHQSGDMRDDCSKIGEHFNPYLAQHGGPLDPIRHVGDLGNIEAGENGLAEINQVDPLVSLSSGPEGVVGRCLVVTSKEDDYGRGNSADSLNNGMSGEPVACGIIAYIR